MQQVMCPRCRQQTLAGQSNGGRALALDIRLDMTPLLAPDEELEMLHRGSRTWTVHHRLTGEMDAWVRGSLQIRTRPAGHTTRQSVHADHVCGQGET